MTILLLESPSTQGWAASMGGRGLCESGNTAQWGPQDASLPKETETHGGSTACLATQPADGRTRAVSQEVERNRMVTGQEHNLCQASGTYQPRDPEQVTMLPFPLL